MPAQIQSIWLMLIWGAGESEVRLATFHSTPAWHRSRFHGRPFSTCSACAFILLDFLPHTGCCCRMLMFWKSEIESMVWYQHISKLFKGWNQKFVQIYFQNILVFFTWCNWKQCKEAWLKFIRLSSCQWFLFLESDTVTTLLFLILRLPLWANMWSVTNFDSFDCQRMPTEQVSIK